MAPEELPPVGREESRQIASRRRGRNWALLAVLGGLALLFYAISMVKLTKS